MALTKGTISIVFGLGLLMMGAGLSWHVINLDCEITREQVVTGPNGEEQQVNRTIDGGPVLCAQNNITNMIISILASVSLFSGFSSLFAGARWYLVN